MDKLNFLWPVEDHVITQGFHGNMVIGKNVDGSLKHAYEVNGQRDMHRALDIRKRLRSESKGSLIKCSYDGVVSRVSNNYGVVVKHVTPLGTFFSMYWHLLEPMVKTGDEVKKGQLIGTMGGDPDDQIPDGGRTTGTHLHYRITKGSVYKREESIDPLNTPYISMVTDLEDRGVGELIHPASKEMVKRMQNKKIIEFWGTPQEQPTLEKIGLIVDKLIKYLEE